MKRRQGAVLAVLGAASLGASPFVPWEDLTESDWLYGVATRFATVDGHRVHYPTPTVELAAALRERAEPAAKRHLAEALVQLGDRPGALSALEEWARSEGAPAWAEAARFGMAHGEIAFAFRAAAEAAPGLQGEEQRALLDEQIRWADAHPEAADPLALRKRRAELAPEDDAAVEDWIRALEGAGRLDEADAALASASGLSEDRNLLLRSDLLSEHGQHQKAYELLDEALVTSRGRGPEWSEAFARRVQGWNKSLPESWRALLEKSYDGRALLRLSTYFQGTGRGEAATDLLRQVERRYESGFARTEFLLHSRLASEIDAVPEAFRARLGAAQRVPSAESGDDLAALADLALRAGGRPLAWGVYRDEPYRFIARIDRTPGFWTGGLSFLLTGQDWKEALSRLEAEALPDRTFATARLLLDELTRRAPAHAAVLELRAKVMARHVERGEGREALALLGGLEAGPAPVADQARKTALLAARLTDVAIAEELRLFRARLLALAPDGSRPTLSRSESLGFGRSERKFRPAAESTGDRYKDVLDDAVARLDQRDATHRTSLDLLLGEMDRLPDAEDLWSDLASRLESWNLDDDLGPRYEQALRRFRGEDIWSRTARWYARRARSRDLDRLAGELAGRFRGAAIFARTGGGSAVTLDVPSQPPAGGRVRLVLWADWVRLKALERFPHSPLVFREAVGRLVARRVWTQAPRRHDQGRTKSVIVEDTLLEQRRHALLFVDADRREEYLAAALRDGRLEALLDGLEQSSARGPVEDRLLFDGWSRLGHFEQAAPAATRLAAAYPGDGLIAGRALALHRSLAALEPGHAAAAQAIVERTAPALTEPGTLFTELGELQLLGGHPEVARKTWARLLEREPRSEPRILELATLLWDYGQTAEALAVLEDGRRRLVRPNLHAFEAGVLREEQHDVEGAIREYLNAALPPEDDDCFCSWFERDQRALRRLSQLLGRERVFKLVADRVARLRPGVAADELTLSSLLPLAQIELPDPGLDFTADDWIDAADLPRDPVGRADRAAARADWRPGALAAIVRIGDALLDKTLQLVPAATSPAFLDTVDRWSAALLDRRWAKDREVSFRSALLLRRAELRPNEEDRVAQEVARIRYLLENGRGADADAAWASLAPRVGALPEGGPRMHAEAFRASFLERTKGVDAAASEWERLGGRYPWSLGVLEERVAFLTRVGRAAEARALIEAAAARAARGHREALLERLTADALAASDLAQARRAVGRLLAEPSLDEAQRLGAVRLLARLSLREDPRYDLLQIAQAEAPRLDPKRHPDLYQTLAEAAEAERADDQAVTLWIEAANRRMERAWVRAGARAALRAGAGEKYRKFFEAQQARSPRDVRWAVAVRELRLEMGDLDGAIEMAKQAVSVRPEREGLWRDATDLLVRAGRAREAGDYYEGWQKARPSDEDAAAHRATLYARAGDPGRALAVEQAALAAFERLPTDSDEDEEVVMSRLHERRSRAVRRMLQLGLPGQAWRLAVGAGGVRALAASGLSNWDAAEVALASGNFLAVLDQRWNDSDYRDAAAAGRLRDYGRPETKQEVLTSLLGRVLPEGPPPARVPRAAVVGPVANFATAAGLDRPLKEAMARRLVSLSSGPWQADPSPTLLAAVADQVLQPATDGSLEFRPPPLEALYVRDLVSRGRDEALWSFLEPRWEQTRALAVSWAPVRKDTPVPEWATWLDDKNTLETWVLGAARRPERVAGIAAVLAERRAWDRLWALAARGWTVGPLVAIVPAEAQHSWFRHWQRPSPLDADAILRARGEAVEKVSLALRRLVEGAPGALADPALERVRGPRTVGDVLGKDPKWLWPEFITPAAPRPTVDPEERILGTGSDLGRLPGALWGERPGAAWFALETLIRFRGAEYDAALVPPETPGRGGEGDRSLTAIRLAAAAGNDGLALELDALLPGANDPARFKERLHLLVRQGRTDEARSALAAETARRQGQMTEAEYRALWRLAEDLGLPDPIDALDPARPVSPVFLAFLYDWKGPAAASRFQPSDPIDFRAALANRWSARPGTLTADAVRFHLATLWVHDASALPVQDLRKLGPAWRESTPWLEHLRPVDREAGLAAVGALPDTARLEEMIARDPEPESELLRLMRLRIALWRNEDDKAKALLSRMLEEVVEGAPLAYTPAVVGEATAVEDEEIADDAVPVAAEDGDAVTARLRTWTLPFRSRNRFDLVRPQVQDALRRRRERLRVGAAEWALALTTSDEAGRAPLLAAMDLAFVRGDLPEAGLGPLVEAIAHAAPAEAPRWLARWPASPELDGVIQRVRALEAMKDRPAAARALFEARAAGTWTLAEEVRAFDLWRWLGFPASSVSTDPVPVAWSAARPFWSKRPSEVGADLHAHLRASAFDVRAARAALRTAAPGDEAALRAASSVLLAAPAGVVDDPDSDADFLGLRIARGLLGAAPRAAFTALRQTEGEALARELARRRIPAAEIDAALADVARIVAKNGPRTAAASIVAALETRNAEAGKALRREIDKAPGTAAPLGLRATASGPAPYRPRDLDFGLLGALAASREGP